MSGMMYRIFYILIFLHFLSPSDTLSFEDFKVDQYDKYFLKYSNVYFGPKFNWHYFKAQAIDESRLKSRAKSPDGAVGVMQLLPETFEPIVRNNPDIRGDIRDPEWNIAAGICYDRMLWEEWHAERSFKNRLNFMFASYNAGKSVILEAQDLAIKKGLNPLVWESIVQTLDLVIGDASKETIAYVNEINKIMKSKSWVKKGWG